jgi:ABC-2 type transport system ATP-binding protein
MASASLSPAASALSCRGLHKRFADTVAVAGVDLEVRAGECFGLLGPNGAGKTTTIEILEGLLPADAGEVILLGGRWADDHARLREKMGIALQETQLPDKLTVREALVLFRSFYAEGRDVDDVIAALELYDKKHSFVSNLSGGQRQRLALGCALVGAPELLFLDEPTTGLDPQARLKVWDVVQSFRARGGTVVMSTHNMEEAARLCDRIAILDHGKVIAHGTVVELLALLGARAMIEMVLAAPVDERAFGVLPGVKSTSRRSDALLLAVDDAAAVLPSVLLELQRQGVSAKQIGSRDATLEDVFVQLTGTSLRDG